MAEGGRCESGKLSGLRTRSGVLALLDGGMVRGLRDRLPELQKLSVEQ